MILFCAVTIVASGGLPTVGAWRDFSPIPPELDSIDARSDFGMVAAGSKEGAQAGIEVLERGGNAIDAAIATTLAQSVADVDALGLGGMTYMVIHLADGYTTAIDGSSLAPQHFDREQLQKLKKSEYTKGHKLVATPTTLATLELARNRYGTMSMAELVQPAIELAETGFRLSALQIIWTNKYLSDILSSRYLSHMVLEDGLRVGSQGTVYCRPDFAATLRRIADEGVGSFYRGSIAAEIDADMVANGGFLRRSDLARVRINEREPVRTTYRGLEVYSFPSPGGGPILIEILDMLDPFPSAFIAGNSIERHHVLTEAFRLAPAVAAATSRRTSHSGWGADSPQGSAGARWRPPEIKPGQMIPESEISQNQNPECSVSTPESTTQISVIDRWGNVVSTTSTLGRSFGATVATPGLGFPYNSFLEYFNYDKAQCPGYLRPLAPCPSGMAPTIVLENKLLKIALGAPGSNRIPSMLANVIINMADRSMSLHDAVEAPRVLWGGEDVDLLHLEMVDPFNEEIYEGLRQIGFGDIFRLDLPDDTGRVVIFGGVNAVGWDPALSTFTGAGDRRRTGFAGGPRVIARPGS